MADKPELGIQVRVDPKISKSDFLKQINKQINELENLPEVKVKADLSEFKIDLAEKIKKELSDANDAVRSTLKNLTSNIGELKNVTADLFTDKSISSSTKAYQRELKKLNTVISGQKASMNELLQITNKMTKDEMKLVKNSGGMLDSQGSGLMTFNKLKDSIVKFQNSYSDLQASIGEGDLTKQELSLKRVIKLSSELNATFTAFETNKNDENFLKKLGVDPTEIKKLSNVLNSITGDIKIQDIFDEFDANSLDISDELFDKINDDIDAVSLGEEQLKKVIEKFKKSSSQLWGENDQASWLSTWASGATSSIDDFFTVMSLRAEEVQKQMRRVAEAATLSDTAGGFGAFNEEMVNQVAKSYDVVLGKLVDKQKQINEAKVKTVEYETELAQKSQILITTLQEQKNVINQIATAWKFADDADGLSSVIHELATVKVNDVMLQEKLLNVNQKPLEVNIDIRQKSIDNILQKIQNALNSRTFTIKGSLDTIQNSRIDGTRSSPVTTSIGIGSYSKPKQNEKHEVDLGKYKIINTDISGIKSAKDNVTVIKSTLSATKNTIENSQKLVNEKQNEIDILKAEIDGLQLEISGLQNEIDTDDKKDEELNVLGEARKELIGQYDYNYQEYKSRGSYGNIEGTLDDLSDEAIKLVERLVEEYPDLISIDDEYLSVGEDFKDILSELAKNNQKTKTINIGNISGEINKKKKALDENKRKLLITDVEWLDANEDLRRATEEFQQLTDSLQQAELDLQNKLSELVSEDLLNSPIETYQDLLEGVKVLYASLDVTKQIGLEPYKLAEQLKRLSGKSDNENVDYEKLYEEYLSGNNNAANVEKFTNYLAKQRNIKEPVEVPKVETPKIEAPKTNETSGKGSTAQKNRTASINVTIANLDELLTTIDSLFKDKKISINNDSYDTFKKKIQSLFDNINISSIADKINTSVTNISNSEKTANGTSPTKGNTASGNRALTAKEIRAMAEGQADKRGLTGDERKSYVNTSVKALKGKVWTSQNESAENDSAEKVSDNSINLANVKKSIQESLNKQAFKIKVGLNKDESTINADLEEFLTDKNVSVTVNQDSVTAISNFIDSMFADVPLEISSTSISDINTAIENGVTSKTLSATLNQDSVTAIDNYVNTMFADMPLTISSDSIGNIRTEIENALKKINITIKAQAVRQQKGIVTSDTTVEDFNYSQLYSKRDQIVARMGKLKNNGLRSSDEYKKLNAVLKTIDKFLDDIQNATKTAPDTKVDDLIKTRLAADKRSWERQGLNIAGKGTYKDFAFVLNNLWAEQKSESTDSINEQLAKEAKAARRKTRTQEQYNEFFSKQVKSQGEYIQASNQEQRIGGSNDTQYSLRDKKWDAFKKTGDPQRLSSLNTGTANGTFTGGMNYTLERAREEQKKASRSVGYAARERFSSDELTQQVKAVEGQLIQAKKLSAEIDEEYARANITGEHIDMARKEGELESLNAIISSMPEIVLSKLDLSETGKVAIEFKRVDDQVRQTKLDLDELNESLKGKNNSNKSITDLIGKIDTAQKNFVSANIDDSTNDAKFDTLRQTLYYLNGKTNENPESNINEITKTVVQNMSAMWQNAGLGDISDISNRADLLAKITEELSKLNTERTSAIVEAAKAKQEWDRIVAASAEKELDIVTQETETYNEYLTLLREAKTLKGTGRSSAKDDAQILKEIILNQRAGLNDGKNYVNTWSLVEEGSKFTNSLTDESFQSFLARIINGQDTIAAPAVSTDLLKMQTNYISETIVEISKLTKELDSLHRQSEITGEDSTEEIDNIKERIKSLVEIITVMPQSVLNSLDFSATGKIASGLDKVNAEAAKTNEAIDKLKEKSNIKNINTKALSSMQKQLESMKGSLMKYQNEILDNGTDNKVKVYDNVVALQNLINSIQNAVENGEDININDFMKQVTDLSKVPGDFSDVKTSTDLIDKLRIAINLASIEKEKLLKTSNGNQTQFNAQANNARTQYNNLAKSLSSYLEKNSKIKSHTVISGNFENAIAKLKEYQSILNTYFNPDEKIRSTVSYKQVSDAILNLQKVKGEISECKAAAKEAGLETTSVLNELAVKIQNKLVDGLLTFAANYGRQVLQQMYQNVVQIDTAMTELRKVTNLTTKEYEQFIETASETSVALGTSLSSYVSSTADQARLGYDIEDANYLAEWSTLLANVGDGIDSVSTASSYLISILKGFSLDASDAEHVVDLINQVANTQPVSGEDLGEILTRSAAALSAAGNSVEETVALGTAMNSVLQSSEKTGTALKTISMFLRASETEAEEAGIETDGMASSVSKLRDTVKSLAGVDIMANEDEFKSTYQILKEISEVWDGLTDVTQANLAQTLAGKNQANALFAILSNFDIAEDALAEATNSAGSAIKENEEYLNSITGKLTQLDSAFQKLSQDYMSSDLVKNVISLLTGAVKLLDKLVETIGALSTTGGLFGGVTALYAAISKDPSKSFRIYESVISNLIAKIPVLNKLQDVLAKKFTITEKTSKLASVGINAMSIAINALAGLAIGFVVSKAVKWFSDWANRISDAAEASSDLSASAQETTESIENLISQYKKLGLQSNQDTEDLETAEEIQKNLTNLLKEQGNISDELTNGLDLRNGKYQEQLDLLKKINVEKVKENIYTYEDDVQNQGELLVDKAKENKLFGKTLGIQNSVTIDKSDREIVEQIAKQYGQTLSDGSNHTGGSLSLSNYDMSDPEEIVRAYNNIESAIAYYGENMTAEERANSSVYKYLTEASNFLSSQVDAYQNAKDVLSEANNIINEQTEGPAISKLKEQLYEYADAFAKYKDYSKATPDGKLSKIGNALSVFDGLTGNAIIGLDKDTANQTEEETTALNSLKTMAEEAGVSFEVFISVCQEYGLVATNVAKSTDTIAQKIEAINTSMDSIQSAYKTSTDAVDEYNSNGYLTLDTLQSLIEMDDEYQSCLDIVNNKLQINKEKYAELIGVQYTKAKTTAVESAIEELNAIAKQANAEAADGVKTSTEAEQKAVANLVPELGNLTNASIAAAYAQELLNASGDASVVDEEATQQVLDNLNTRLTLIQASFDAAINSGAALTNQLNGSSDSSNKSSTKSTHDAISAISDLIEVMREYNRYGYISANTLKTLTGLESQYVACLVEEDGQMKISTDKLRDYVKTQLTTADADDASALSTEKLTQMLDWLNDSANNGTITLDQLIDYLEGYGAAAEDAAEETERLKTALDSIDSGNTSKKDTRTGVANYDANNSYGESLKALKEFGGDELAKSAYDSVTGNLSYDTEAFTNATKKALSNQIKAYEQAGDETSLIMAKSLQSSLDAIENGEMSAEEYFKGQSNMISEANEKLDDYQSTYQTLLDAVSEYTKTGTLSQDTLQSLTELDDKYLNCLTYENGQLKLNQDAYKALYIAELEELALKYEGTKQGEIYAAMLNDVSHGFNGMANNLCGAEAEFEELENVMSDFKDILETVLDLMEEYNSNKENELNWYAEAMNDEIEKRIDALNDEKDALSDKNDEMERAAELAELQEELARAQSQRSNRVYTSNGYEWQVDASAVREASQNLADKQREYSLEDAETAIDNQIEALEQLQDEWSEATDLVGKSLDEYNAKMKYSAQVAKMTTSEMKSSIASFSISAKKNMKSASVTEWISDMISKIETLIGVAEKANDIFNFLDSGTWTEGGAQGLITTISKFFTENGQAELADKATNIATKFGKAQDVIKTGASKLFKTDLPGIVQKGMNLIQNAAGDSGILQSIVNLFSGAGGSGILSNIGTVIKNVIGGISGGGGISGIVSSIVTGIKGVFAGGGLSGILGSISVSIPEIGAVVAAVGASVGMVINTIEKTSSANKKLWADTTKSLPEKILGTIWNWIYYGLGLDYFVESFKLFQTAIQNFIDGDIWEGLKNCIKAIWKASLVARVVDGIATLLKKLFGINTKTSESAQEVANNTSTKSSSKADKLLNNASQITSTDKSNDANNDDNDDASSDTSTDDSDDTEHKRQGASVSRWVINPGGSLADTLTGYDYSENANNSIAQKVIHTVTHPVETVVKGVASATSWLWKKITGKHAAGLSSAKTGHWANVDEKGSEIIVRKPQSGRYTYLETGDGVVPADITSRLFEMGGNPDKWFQDQLAKNAFETIQTRGGTAQAFNIGDININNPVGDTDALAREIKNNLPAKVAQYLNKR